MNLWSSHRARSWLLTSIKAALSGASSLVNCLTMPRCSRTSVSKNDAGKSDDLTSYAASHIAHITPMLTRTPAIPIVAEQVGQPVSTPASSSVPTTANLAFHSKKRWRTTPSRPFSTLPSAGLQGQLPCVSHPSIYLVIRDNQLNGQVPTHPKTQDH